MNFNYNEVPDKVLISKVYFESKQCSSIVKGTVIYNVIYNAPLIAGLLIKYMILFFIQLTCLFTSRLRNITPWWDLSENMPVAT